MATKNAAHEAEQERLRRRAARLNLLGVGGLVAFLVVVAVVLNLARDTGTAPVDAPAAGTSAYGVTVGEESAPTAVVVYEDFVCPFCGQFEAASSADLEALAAEGKVIVDYRPFDLLGTDYSRDAAHALSVVLEQSGREVAKELHDALFAEQPEESGPFPDQEWYVEQAVRAGAVEDDVRPGIEAADRTWVESATDEALAAGVEGTPTILVDGEVFEDFDDVEEAATALVSLIEDRSATIEP